MPFTFGPQVVPDHRGMRATICSARRKDLLFLVGALLVIVLALAFRVTRLDVPNDNYDEGVYLESLLLMHDGYLPFRDIVATQGPLHLYLAYPAYALGGHTLTAARLGAVTGSMLGVFGVVIAGSVLVGRVAGLVAGLIFALSPTYLTVSRQALPEPAAIGLVAIAVACAGVARRTCQQRWRLAAGVLLGLACLIKPTVAVAAVPVVLLSGDGRSLRSWVTAPVAAGLVGMLGLAGVGLDGSLGQVVGWRLAAGQLRLDVVPWNAALLIDKMWSAEQPMTYALTIAGIATLWVRERRLFVAWTGWVLCSLISLLMYSELSGHLGSTLIAPLALLGGAAVGFAVRELRGPRRRQAFIIAPLVVAWAILALPSVVSRDRQIVSGAVGTDHDGPGDELEAASAIASSTAAGKFIITDAPYLAFLADRRVPPALIDPSLARIRAGATTSEQMIGGLDLYDADVVVLWTGKLARLGPFMDTLGRDYAPVASFGTIDHGTPRAVYVRRDDDDAAAEDADSGL
jgi:hypothetical protein